MLLGLYTASEEYQRRMMQQLKGLEGTVIVADNILFNGCGDNKEKAEKEYDDNLVKLSEARGQQNFTLNLEKVR